MSSPRACSRWSCMIACVSWSQLLDRLSPVPPSLWPAVVDQLVTYVRCVDAARVRAWALGSADVDLFAAAGLVTTRQSMSLLAPPPLHLPALHKDHRRALRRPLPLPLPRPRWASSSCPRRCCGCGRDLLPRCGERASSRATSLHAPSMCATPLLHRVCCIASVSLVDAVCGGHAHIRM